MKKSIYIKPVLTKYENIESITYGDGPGVVSEGNLGTWSANDCDSGKFDGGDPFNTANCLVPN